MTVVVGVDGAGRTHRLDVLAAATPRPVVRVTATPGPYADLDGPGRPDDLTARLAAAHADGALVLVDDAHRLDASTLGALATAARYGVAMVVARRPTIDRAELADLDEAVAGQGPVEQLGPLDDDALAALVAAVAGRPATADQVAAVREASAGLAAVAAAVAAAPDGPPPAGLVARVQRRLAVHDPRTAELARVLALRLDLTDDVLAAAVGTDLTRTAAAMRSLRDEGLLVPDGERMIPAVARAVLAELPPAGRRRLHDTVARALVAAGADPVVAAGQLRAARARTPAAAAAYRAAADRLRFVDPTAAISWYDDALDAGADPGTVAAGRAEATALVGLPVDRAPADVDDATAGPADASRLALVAGAVAAHQGRADRAAEALLEAAAPGPVLAAPALVATGRPDAARAAAAGAGPPPLRLFAEAVRVAGDPAAALPLLIEAAEAVEQAPPQVVLPDTPHALGALVAVTAGDTPSAEHLLDRALAAGVGGPVARDRHHILLAWARMRAGRYDTAVAELHRLATVPLAGRDRVLVAALSAGIARRSGDIAQLRDAWTRAEPVLARQATDLFLTEPVEELLIAAARLRQHHRIDPVLDTLDAILDRLGHPVAWIVSVGWIRLHVAVADEDPGAAAAAARRLAALAPAGPRQLAQCAAAGHWAAALAGDVDPDGVLAAADGLATADLPWEASRLAGHAAIHTSDTTAARRLLERARELARAEPVAEDRRPEAPAGVLSDREREVARLVLAGRTHREIGAQLYLSPKTVEHHVARIRTKLGATNRAEFVAALRTLLEDGPIG